MSNPLRTFDKWANTWTAKPDSETKQMARSIFLLVLVVLAAIAVGVTYLALWFNYPLFTLALHSIPLISFLYWLIKD